jgi:hypothetical protein
MSNNFPVRLLCNYYVCNGCLTERALVEGNNSCPMDRSRLYWSEEFEEHKQNEEDEDQVIITDRERRRALGTGEAWQIILADANHRIAFTKDLWRDLFNSWSSPASRALLPNPAYNPQYFQFLIPHKLSLWPAARPYQDIMRAEKDLEIFLSFPLVRLESTMSVTRYSAQLSGYEVEVWWGANANCLDNYRFDVSLVKYCREVQTTEGMFAVYWFTMLLAHEVYMKSTLWSGHHSVRNRELAVDFASRIQCISKDLLEMCLSSGFVDTIT